MKLRSMREDCYTVAIRLEKLCRRWNIKLEIFWISRYMEQTDYYDRVSKEVAMSGYWISYKEFW